MASSLPYIMVEHYGGVDHACTQMFNLKMGNVNIVLNIVLMFKNIF